MIFSTQVLAERWCECGCRKRTEQACRQQGASVVRIKGGVRPSRVLSMTSVLCTPQGPAQTGELWPEIMPILFLYTSTRTSNMGKSLRETER